MTLQTLQWLACDQVGCTAYFPEVNGWIGPEVKSKAEQVGWQRLFIGDFCPDHQIKDPLDDWI